MRSKQRQPFLVKVIAPATGLNTRLPPNLIDKPVTAYTGSGLRDSSLASNMRFEDGVACNAPGFEAVDFSPTLDGAVNLISQANLVSQLAPIANTSPLFGTTKSLYAMNINSGYLRVFAGSDQIIINASTATITATYLDTFGTGSNVPAFLWTQLSGPVCTITSPTAASTTLTGMAPGSYTFQVKASDSGTNTTAMVKVLVYYVTAYSPANISFQNESCMVCPTNGFVYFNSGIDSGNTITIYDPYTNTIAGTISPPMFSGAGSVTGMVYNAGDGYIYATIGNVAVGQTGCICKIDPSTNTIINTLIPTTGLSPESICLISGTTAVCATHNSYWLIIDLPSMTQTSATATGAPSGRYTSESSVFDGILVYSTSQSNGTRQIYTFNPQSLAVYNYEALASSGNITLCFCSANSTVYFQGSGGIGSLNATSSTAIASSITQASKAPLYDPYHQRVYFLDWHNGVIIGLNPVSGVFDPPLEIGASISLAFAAAYQWAYNSLTNSFYIPTSSTNIIFFNAP
jgi:hypothetical protein